MCSSSSGGRRRRPAATGGDHWPHTMSARYPIFGWPSDASACLFVFGCDGDSSDRQSRRRSVSGDSRRPSRSPARGAAERQNSLLSATSLVQTPITIDRSIARSGKRRFLFLSASRLMFACFGIAKMIGLRAVGGIFATTRLAAIAFASQRPTPRVASTAT